MIRTFTHCILISILYSCAGQKSNIEVGVLKGTIGVFEGNCMPGPGVPPCEPRPISTTIYVTKPTQNFDRTMLVDSTISNTEGYYIISLPQGKYSLFLKDENQVVCSEIQCPNECFCNPFKMVNDSTTVINANLDHATW